MTPNMQIALVTLFVAAASTAVVLHKDQIDQYFDKLNDNTTSTQQQPQKPAVKAEKPAL